MCVSASVCACAYAALANPSHRAVTFQAVHFLVFLRNGNTVTIFSFEGLKRLFERYVREETLPNTAESPHLHTQRVE